MPDFTTHRRKPNTPTQNDFTTNLKFFIVSKLKECKSLSCTEKFLFKGLPVIAGVLWKHRIQSKHFTSPLAFKPIGCETERKIRGRSESRRHRETERKIRGRMTTTPPVSPPPTSKSPFKRLVLPCDRTPTANPNSDRHLHSNSISVGFLLHQQRQPSSPAAFSTGDRDFFSICDLFSIRDSLSRFDFCSNLLSYLRFLLESACSTPPTSDFYSKLLLISSILKKGERTVCSIHTSKKQKKSQQIHKKEEESIDKS
ncbi:hypothetical protein LXL04_037395 [Taraxacum kok-saghyz]